MRGYWPHLNQISLSCLCWHAKARSERTEYFVDTKYKGFVTCFRFESLNAITNSSNIGKCFLEYPYEQLLLATCKSESLMLDRDVSTVCSTREEGFHMVFLQGLSQSRHKPPSHSHDRTEALTACLDKLVVCRGLGPQPQCRNKVFAP